MLDLAMIVYLIFASLFALLFFIEGLINRYDAGEQSPMNVLMIAPIAIIEAITWPINIFAFLYFATFGKDKHEPEST